MSSAAPPFLRQQPQSLQTQGSQPFSPAQTTASSISYSAYNQTPTSNYASTSRNLSSASGNYPGVPPARMPINGTGSRNGSGASGTGLKPPTGERKGESKEVARIHWIALKEFLASWLKEETAAARAAAREKLTRLTKLQFQELSTDVYDELMRRKQAEQGSPEDSIPFLPVRDDFHPKRNQARQKLATLPRNRFKDLASDVYFELRRRYPEFEDEDQDDNNYIDPPPAPGPPARPALTTAQSGSDQQYRSRSNPTPPPPPLSRLQSSSSQHQRSGSRSISGSSINTHRSRPSRDDRGDEMEQLNQGPAPAYGQSSSRGQGRAPNMNPVGATSDMVVPNKSRMREEEIEVPYARDSVLEVGRSRSRASGRDGDRDSQMSAGTSISARQAPPPNIVAPPMRSVNQPITSANDTLSPTMTDDREYYDRMSFSSNVTGKSRMGAGVVDEERIQKITQDYEFRIVGFERKMAVLETEKEEMRRALQSERERRTEWEDEVRGLKERATNHASSLRSVQHELDIARDAAETARSHAEQSARQGEEELGSWRERHDGLEEEMRRLEEENVRLRNQVASSRGGDGGSQAVAELKNEIHSLVDELNILSAKNEELMVEREQDAAGMNEMEARVDEYRRKYDAVRIELRNLKATSTMFVSKPLSDDHLPASPDGNIADVNVSAFQTAIDGLLAAARSSAPSGVLPAMKAVVEATTEIGQDVKTFEAKPNLDVDSSKLESLKHESTTRLSALMQAARNHAMASGLSPVSLLDGAAGHLSSNVVEIIKLLKIRRTARRSRSSLSIRDMVGRDAKGANGSFDREYGAASGEISRSNSRQNLVVDRAPSAASSRPPVSRNGTSERQTTSPVSALGTNSVPQPPSSYLGNANNQLSARSLGEPGTHLRANVNSYQSASSQARSDSFDLERKASVISNPRDQRPVVESRNGNGNANTNGYRPSAGGDRSYAGPIPGNGPAPPGAPMRSASGNADDRYVPSRNRARSSDDSDASSHIAPITARSASRNQGPGLAEVRVEDDGERSPGVGYAQGEGSEEEWEELKPYLNAQSSALVNSIQNLLAAIRTNQQTPALTEHLSEVIAIASSIVAVAGNALPAALRFEGEGLLKGLVNDTNRLSEAQEAARGAGFGKEVRQGIAAASFGVAKGLKSLMKLGVE